MPFWAADQFELQSRLGGLDGVWVGCCWSRHLNHRLCTRSGRCRPAQMHQLRTLPTFADGNDAHLRLPHCQTEPQRVSSQGQQLRKQKSRTGSANSPAFPPSRTRDSQFSSCFDPPDTEKFVVGMIRAGVATGRDESEIERLGIQFLPNRRLCCCGVQGCAEVPMDSAPKTQALPSV